MPFVIEKTKDPLYKEGIEKIKGYNKIYRDLFTFYLNSALLRGLSLNLARDKVNDRPLRWN